MPNRTKRETIEPDLDDFVAPCPSAECTCDDCQAYTTGALEHMRDRVITADDETGYEITDCPICGGPLLPLGVLGRRLHSRCRNCGIDHSVAIE